MFSKHNGLGVFLIGTLFFAGYLALRNFSFSSSSEPSIRAVKPSDASPARAPAAAATPDAAAPTASAEARAAGPDDISGPPRYDATFQTRAVRTCAPLKSEPTLEQIVALVQCYGESRNEQHIELLTQVQVTRGEWRHVLSSDYDFTYVDATHDVIPLHGSYTSYYCTPGTDAAQNGKDFETYASHSGTGLCYVDKSRDWHCSMLGGKDSQTVTGQPPLLTY